MVPPDPGPLFQALKVEGPEDLAPGRSLGAVEVTAPALDRTEAALRRLFGFASFRPGQREVVDAVLAGRDTLAVMPTGGGKSLTYLLPAFLLPGVTVVVSPLISLMQDQVAKLHARGLPAAAVNSTQSWEQQRQTLDRLRRGELKLVFVAPERFRNARFLQALAGTPVSLLGVDEAHCVSQWGHDFRPDYLRLGEAAQGCGRPPILAVTATATHQVRQDIARQLGLSPEALVVVRGFDRPNLHLSVQVVTGGDSIKQRALFALLGRVPAGPGIIYCATRKGCDRVARAFSREGSRKIGVYHAGLSDPVRKRVQERFFSGDLDLVVATNAFGLGIDKQDLSFVIHHDLPGSLEAYYQEAGRAGRDGRPSACVLAFAPQDIHLQRFFISTNYPERALIERVARQARRVGNDAAAIARGLPERVNERAVESALRLLEQAQGDPGAIDFAQVEARAAHAEGLLQHMIGYAYGRGCRRRAILDYFGAPPPDGPCGACDRCAPAPERPSALAPRAPAAKAAAAKAGATKGAAKPARAAKPAQTSAEPEVPAVLDQRLLERLRQLRRDLARKARTKPYRVFHDRTLFELAARQPRTRQALLEVYGLGETKVARWGDAILTVLACWAPPEPAKA